MALMLANTIAVGPPLDPQPAPLTPEDEALFSAVRQGHVGGVKAALARPRRGGGKRANVNAVRLDVLVPGMGHGHTPLMYAANLGNIEIVRVLIRKGADVNALRVQERGGLWCPIEPRCEALNAIGFAIDALMIDATLGTLAANLILPRHYRMEEDKVVDTVKEIIVILHEHGCAPVAGRPNTALHQVIMTGDFPSVLSLLVIDLGYSVHELTELRSGEPGESAFELAVEWGAVESARVLGKELGADVNTTHNNMTPLGLAVYDTGIDCLVKGARHDLVRMLVTEFGFDVNETCRTEDEISYTPLHCAISSHHPGTVDLLLSDLGADPNAPDPEYHTALRHACVNSFVDSFISIFQSLLLNGADDNPEVCLQLVRSNKRDEVKTWLDAAVLNPFKYISHRPPKGTNRTCTVCSKRTAKKCGACRMVTYCSKDCVQADWPNHKLVCAKHTAVYEQLRRFRDWPGWESGGQREGESDTHASESGTRELGELALKQEAAEAQMAPAVAREATEVAEAGAAFAEVAEAGAEVAETEARLARAEARLARAEEAMDEAEAEAEAEEAETGAALMSLDTLVEAQEAEEEVAETGARLARAGARLTRAVARLARLKQEVEAQVAETGARLARAEALLARVVEAEPEAEPEAEAEAEADAEAEAFLVQEHEHDA